MLDLKEQQALPCLEELIAMTMALMTTWANPAAQPSAAPCRHRTQLARKIVANLFVLQRHPQVSPQLGQVLGNLHQRWVDMARSAMQQQGMELPAAMCHTGVLH